jgi:hypothetical protein
MALNTIRQKLHSLFVLFHFKFGTDALLAISAIMKNCLSFRWINTVFGVSKPS